MQLVTCQWLYTQYQYDDRTHTVRHIYIFLNFLIVTVRIHYVFIPSCALAECNDFRRPGPNKFTVIQAQGHQEPHRRQAAVNLFKSMTVRDYLNSGRRHL
jgi:hypothetical protein